jgi:glycosyltransferase involved in cell wall biosynthesis
MNIWLVTIGETLPLTPGVRKMRTAMLADNLLARGHSIRWWVSAFEHQRKVMLFDSDQQVPLSPGMTLQILRGNGYSSNISPARYWDHRLIARKFRQEAVKLEPPDVMVTSMPCHHLSYEAVRYAHLRNIPVLVDVRDLWPDIFLARIKNPIFKKLGRLALSSDFSRLQELLTAANGLVAVSKGYLDWGLEKAGRPVREWDRVFFLGYQAASGSVRPSMPSNPLPCLRGHETKKLILFIGTFGFSYELSLVVESARRLQSSGRQDACFILAGAGEHEEEIRRKSEGLSNVLLPGWLDAPQILSLLRLGYLGLVPCISAKDTLPNKPFEYLSAGLPLVSSLEGEMTELINDFGLGLSYRVGDLDGLCRALETLLDNPSLRKKMSVNAQGFFQEYGDADKIYENYAKHVENLAEGGKVVSAQV